MPYTTANLLRSIGRRSIAPSNQNTFTPEELLEMADEETRGEVIPSIMKLREDYFVMFSDLPLIADQSDYAVPSRASGLVVRDLHLVAADNSVTRLRRTEIESVTTYASGSPSSFHFRSNKIVLRPTPSAASSTLRVFYNLSPAMLVTTDATAVITAIDTTTNQLTVGAIPSTWATGDTFDLTKQDGGQEALAVDLESTDISANVITLPSLPGDLRVGDYVSLAGETSLLQMPAEYRDVLAQAVAVRVLGDTSQAGADRAEKKLAKLLLAAEKQFRPRSIGEPSLIANNNWS